VNHRLCLSVVIPFALFACTPLHAQHAGGHFGGGSGGVGLSGHSVGHAVSHSFGHVFGHRSGGHDSRMGKISRGRGDEASIAGAAFIHGKVVQLPGPAGATALIERPRHPAPAGFVSAKEPNALLHAKRQFGSGFCGSFGFSWHNFLFPGDFDCFGDPFLFDPFFSGRFIAGHFRSDSIVTASGSTAQSAPKDSSQAADGAGGTTSLRGSPASLPGREFSTTAAVTEDAPFTLLQLRDGSMYGLTRYWVEGDRLYYVTNYGGENSVPLDRVDIVETTKLNSERSTPFVLPSAAPPQ
jgi:hypothetical protein